jgi:hypothetical protein
MQGLSAKILFSKVCACLKLLLEVLIFLVLWFLSMCGHQLETLEALDSYPYVVPFGFFVILFLSLIWKLGSAQKP